MSKYDMASDLRATWMGMMQLLVWQVGPRLGEDHVRDTMYEMMAKPNGTTSNELCEKFGVTAQDRKDMGFPFFIEKPRKNVVFHRQ